MSLAVAERTVGGHVRQRYTVKHAYLAAILMDQSGLDQAEFLWKNPDPQSNGVYRARPYQWRWWRCRDPRQIDQCARSVGKALDIDTEIPTVNGWKRMADIGVGDHVFDDEGRPVTVIGAYDVLHDRDCYEVEFDDGSVILADAEHRWGTRTKARATSHKIRVRTTEEIAATLQYGQGSFGTRKPEANHRVPVAAPLDLPTASLLIPPYTLGAWLGDGSSYRAHLCAHPPDDEFILSEIRADGFAVKQLTDPRQYAIAYPYAVNHKTGTVSAHLRVIGVLEDKHIPADYLRASADQRLALLQGLMDTDGHVTVASRCEITLAKEQLARDVFELLASLGQKPFLEKRTAYCNGVDAGPVYRVGFRPLALQPFRLPRKAIRVRPVTQVSRVAERRIVDVRPAPSRPVRCITVDSDSGLYLAGRAMIPTHNTEGIMARILAFPFSYPSLEMALVAPQGKHVKLIAARVEPVINQNRFYKALLKKGVREGITHAPFEIFWQNGATLVSRLPQLTGLGLKGLHPVRLEVDEGQDIDDRAYAELPAVVRWEIDGARWMIHGVPKGVIDKFFKYTLPDSGFRVHRILAMHDATWTPEKEEHQIKEYGGSKQSPDYQRNVYGEHSQSANRIVLLANLYACTDSQEGSTYNTVEYKHFELSPEVVMDQVGVTVADVDEAILESSEAQAQALRELLDFPNEHRAYDLTWAGMDFGLVADPSELLVAAEYTPDAKELAADRAIPGLKSPKDGLSRLKILCRISMSRLPAPLQAEVIMHVCDFYKLRAFSMDATGNGLGTWQELKRRTGKARLEIQDFTEGAPEQQTDERAVSALTKIKGYNFSQKLLVGIHDEIAEQLDNPTNQEIADKAGIWLHMKDFATDQIRELVDAFRMRFPHDEDILNDINAQTWAANKEVVDPYTGRRRYSYSVGQFHILDGLRCLVVGRYMTPMEQFLETKKERKPVMARFGY